MFSVQPKRHEDGDEWEKLLHRQLMPYGYHILLHKVPGGKRGDQHHVLSNASRVSGLFHKNAAEILVS